MLRFFSRRWVVLDQSGATKRPSLSKKKGQRSSSSSPVIDVTSFMYTCLCVPGSHAKFSMSTGEGVRVAQILVHREELAQSDDISIQPLKSLDMSYSEGNQDDWAAVAQALVQLRQLHRLQLQCSPIGDPGLFVIIDACRQIPTLSWLGLRGCYFGVLGANRLGSAFGGCLEIQDLPNLFCGSKISENCKQTLAYSDSDKNTRVHSKRHWHKIY
mmetsp:Transcript_23063/g.32541  ORF Transcript_23063/g.32541 Transcript_23063/m.32541 type:complete len:214 (-) Transcript_23063:309-950(-)